MRERTPQPIKRSPLSSGSLRWKLPLVFCMSLLVVTAALSWAAYLNVRKSVLVIAEDRLQGVARELSGMLAASGRQLNGSAHELADDPVVRSYLASRSRAEERRAAATLRHADPADTTIIAAELLDANGEQVLAVGPAGNRVHTPSNAELEQAARSQEMAAIGTFRLLGDTIVYPTMAIMRAGNRRIGHVVQWRRVASTDSSDSPIQRIIGSGALFYIGGGGGAWTDLRGPVPEPPVDVSDATGVMHYEHRGSGGVMAASRHVAGTPWLLLLEFPNRTVLAPVRQFVGRIVIIGVLVALIGLVGASVLSRSITRPLRQLTDAASAISGADYSKRVEVNGRDELAHLAGAFNVMAERLDDEMAARRRSEDQWRLLFEANPQPMWVYDPESLKFVAVNDAAIAQYGYSAREFESMKVTDINPAEDVPALLAELKQMDDDTSRMRRHRTKDGRIIDVDVTSHALIFGLRRARLVLAQDVTEKLELESQLRQAQKMEAVGRLAGGVAHDFNNALAVISTYTELLQEPDLNGHDGRRATYIDSIQKAARHAQSLTRQLLAFSRRQVLQPVDLDANTAVKGIDQILRRLIGEDIEFHTRLAPDAGKVRVDPGQFEQVLLNLAVNARDAMPSGGRLTMTTERVELDEASARLHSLPRPGDYVMISVADTGTGMSSETRARVFEPFFTTKAEGKGTGLGLATVYGIVTQSGGDVTVYSEPGHGSIFRVYLPRLADDEEWEEQTPVSPAPLKGAETILLVEDDEAVRDMVAEVLDIQGYTVLVASTPDEALAIAQKREQPIDMVLSDVVMPHMDGPTLVGRLHELRPGLKVLLMSGYTGDAIMNRGVERSKMPFLEKPFTVKGISTKVREVLDSD